MQSIKARPKTIITNLATCLLRASFTAAYAFAFCIAALASDEQSAGMSVPGASIAESLDASPIRAALASHGISYGLNYVGDFFEVAAGAVSRGSSFNGRIETFVDVDLERLVGWKGGILHTNGYAIYGEGPSTKHINNIFSVSNIEALETYRLFELWIEQSLLADKLNMRLGLLAADSEFFISETAGQFLNGTFGWPGITASNMIHGGPAYPLAAPSIYFQVSPTDQMTLLAAAFIGVSGNSSNVDPQRENRHGTNFQFGDDTLLMLEAQVKYDVCMPGVLKLGGWKQTNDTFSDQLTNVLVDENHGFYVVLDQQLWKAGDNKDISAFGRVSRSPDRQNLIDLYFDVGIVFTGLIDTRPRDSFGFAFGYGAISDRASNADILAGLPVVRDFEAVLEVNYQAEIMRGWTIVPNFQYVWHPGGNLADPKDPLEIKPIGDAAIVGIRANLAF